MHARDSGWDDQSTAKYALNLIEHITANHARLVAHFTALAENKSH